MTPGSTTPKWARRFLAWTVDPERYDDVMGDLEEVHARRTSASPGWSAWLATSSEALQIGAAMGAHRIGQGAQDAVRGMNWTELRLAVRMNARHPFLTATAVVSLSVGIMLATAGFTLLHALLFSELPEENGDRFVTIRALPAPGETVARIDADRLDAFRSEANRFAYLGALAGTQLNMMNEAGDVVPVVATYITPTVFGRLDFAPIHGRPLLPEDGEVGESSALLLSERFWVDRFGADPDIIGTRLQLGDRERRVIGVAPSSVQFPNSPDVWIAMDERFLRGSADDQGPAVGVFGILEAGAATRAAEAQLLEISARFDGRMASEPIGIQVVSMTDVVGDSPILYIFSGLVLVLVLVLLVIAANVANLMVARTAARSGELAVRSALGAGRTRLVTQLFGEALVIGGLAAGIGLFAAIRFMTFFRNLIDEMPYWVDFGLQPSVVVFVVTITLLASAVCGLLPALRATGDDPAQAMQSRGSSGGRAFGRFSRTMISVEMALSVALLVAALVAARGALEYANPEFDLPDDRVLTASIALSADPSAGDGRQAFQPLLTDLVREIQSLPGVRFAGLADGLPRQFAPTVDIQIDGEGSEPMGPTTAAPMVRAGPGFLEAVGGEALLGRTFRREDYLPGAAAVAVVNEPLVASLFGGRNPIGRRLRLPQSVDLSADELAPWIEIVGVVADLGMSLGNRTLAGGVYLPLLDGTFVYVAALTDGQATDQAAALRRAIANVDPALMVRRLQPLSSVSVEEATFISAMAGTMAALGMMALVLSLAGMYAVMSFSVTRRTREIGIRIALGATASGIARSGTGRAGWQLLVAATVGSGLGWALLQMRRIFMFRIPDPDAQVFLLVVGLMLASGLIAAWMPVRRALEIRPQEALRSE